MRLWRATRGWMNAATALALVAMLMLASCTSSSEEPVETSVTTTTVILGEELVFNGDFAQGDAVPDGWDLTSYEPDQVAEWIEDGERGRVAHMAAPVVADVGWPQLVLREQFAVEAGRSYRLTVTARTDDIGLLFMAVAFLDAGGTEIGGIGPGSPSFDSQDWTEHHFDFEAVPDAVSAYVVLNLALNQAITDEPDLSIDVGNVSIRPIEG